MEHEIASEYLAQLKRYPLLSAEEERELSDRIQEGDKAALDKMIKCNLRLVVSLSKNFLNTCESVMDLIQEGNIGLITAAKKFNASYKTRFSTYAYPWIIQYMIRYLNSHSAMISLPTRKDQILRKIQNARQELFSTNGRMPTEQQIASHIGISMALLRNCLKYEFTIASLDTLVSEGENSVSLGDLISDTTYSPENQYLNKEQKNHIRSLMNKLPLNERKVIWYRYNFECEQKTKTLREVSSLLGVSPEAIRQTEMRAIRHMKNETANANVTA